MSKFQKHDLNKAPNELAREILDMINHDQEARFSNAKNIKEIDTKNTNRMKEIIFDKGWPTIEMVGEEASSSAWLLIQHADLDPDFQEESLNLIKELPEGQVSKENIAYLEDRVRVVHGKSTLYGTQFYRRDDGKLVPREIEDSKNIDIRRKEMGLDTLDEYVEFFYSNCPKESIPDEYLT